MWGSCRTVAHCRACFLQRTGRDTMKPTVLAGPAWVCLLWDVSRLETSGPVGPDSGLTNVSPQRPSAGVAPPPPHTHTHPVVLLSHKLHCGSLKTATPKKKPRKAVLSRKHLCALHRCCMRLHRRGGNAVNGMKGSQLGEEWREKRREAGKETDAGTRMKPETRRKTGGARHLPKRPQTSPRTERDGRASVFVFTQEAGTVTARTCVCVWVCVCGCAYAAPSGRRALRQPCCLPLGGDLRTVGSWQAPSFSLLNSGCSRVQQWSLLLRLSPLMHVGSSTTVPGNRLFPT